MTFQIARARLRRKVRAAVPALAAVVFFIAAATLQAAETIPAKPTRYFNDYALTVKPETAEKLNRELEDLEKQTSNQILAVIYPRMLSDSSVEDYCQRVYRAWKPGQADKNNGAILFVFVENHKIHIQTGYGLEGALPDATCKQIISDEMGPRFKANDFDGGMTAGVESMIKATKGEYKGTGTTKYAREHQGSSGGSGGLSLGTILFLLFIGYTLFSAFRHRRGGAMYTGGGPIFFPTSFGGGFGGGGGSGGGGGGSSDGGGFFSSGGGDSGGGGASGDW